MCHPHTDTLNYAGFFKSSHVSDKKMSSREPEGDLPTGPGRAVALLAGSSPVASEPSCLSLCAAQGSVQRSLCCLGLA